MEYSGTRQNSKSSVWLQAVKYFILAYRYLKYEMNVITSDVEVNIFILN